MGVGPIEDIIYASTEFDKLAPPKDLTVSLDTNKLMKIEWESSCSSIDTDIGYKVCVILAFQLNLLNEFPYLISKLRKIWKWSKNGILFFSLNS